jgi:hypothetical protein
MQCAIVDRSNTLPAWTRVDGSRCEGSQESKSETLAMIALIRAFLSIFLPPPKDTRTAEELARVERAWADVFRRLEEQRKLKGESRVRDYRS